MIYTARQLEELHKTNGNGQVVLPYGARLSPLASDWARSKKVSVGYSNIEAPVFAVKPVGMTAATPATGGANPLLWWCDGPCGAAKAAIVAQGKESTLTPIDLPGDTKAIVKVIKHLAGEVKAGRASGGVLLVQSGAAAVIFANRCPALRAIIGTCLEAVEQGIQQVAANVLIIEYPHRTLMQVRNVLSRFARGNRQLSDEVQQQLKDLASCG
jgi:ribose 5-phosphate isomerase RpiB